MFDEHGMGAAVNNSADLPEGSENFVLFDELFKEKLLLFVIFH